MQYLSTGQFFGETDKTILLDGITLTDTEYTIEKVDWHYHENPYFTFITAGKIFEGSKKDTHNCPAGTLLFHNWQEPHFNVKPKGYTRGFQLEAETDWFENFEIALTELPSYTNIADSEIKILFYKIYKEAKLFDSESSLNIESLLLKILSKLGNSQKIRERKMPKWVKTIDEILHENRAENLSLKYLSKVLNLHPIYLCQTFPKFFGCNFGEYVRKIKIERSLSLLHQRELSLTEIAFVCGFADQSHFIRCFKKLIGLSPKQYLNLFSK